MNDAIQRALLEKALREKNKRDRDSLANLGEWLPVACPDYTWSPPHFQYLIHKLEQVAAGKIKKLCIFIPPRHGKSELTSVRFPAYLLERNPEAKIAVASTSSFLAEEFSRKCRDLVRQRNKVQLNYERQSVMHWKTQVGGFLRAVGVGGTIVGQGYDYIIIDDPVKNREEVESPAQRDRLWNWFLADVYSRRNTKDAAIVVILTRWHEDDLGGRILNHNDPDDPNGWTVVRIPAICEGDDPEDYPVQREVGEALWEERVPLTMLDDIKGFVGENFTSLYQQRPAPKEGKIFKRDWFLERVNQYPSGVTKLTQMWDTAMSKNRRSDCSAMVEGGVDETTGKIYVSAMVNEKMEFPELLRSARNEFDRVGYERCEVCTEDKANGLPLSQQLRQDGIPVITVPSGTDDKEIRAKSITPYCESGQVVLVEKVGNYNSEMITQLLNFPNGKHDDLLDAFVHLIRRLMARKAKWSSLDLADVLSRGVASNNYY